MSPAVQSEVSTVLPLLVQALAGALLVAIAYGTAWLKAHTKSIKGQYIEDRLGTVAEDAARQVSQTYTDDIKARNGSLTLYEQSEALSRAMALAKANLGKTGIDAIKKLLAPEDVEKQIESAILSAHHEIKADAAAAAPAASAPAAVAVAVAPAAPVVEETKPSA